MVQQYSTTRPSRVRKIPNRYKEETVVLKPCSLKPPKYIELNAHPSQKGCKKKMYNVDSIAGIKTLGGVLWHKVRWTGYSHKSDMWLKATNLSTDLGRKGLADMLAEYNSGSTVFSKAHLKSVVTVTNSGLQARKRPRRYIPPEVVAAWLAGQTAARIRCRIRMLREIEEREREERAIREREMQQREREEREMQERYMLAEQNAGRIRPRIRVLREREERKREQRAMKEREIQQRKREERECSERAMKQREMKERKRDKRAMKQREIQQRKREEREREERAIQEREMQQREMQERAMQEREMQERNIQWLGAEFSQSFNTASGDDDTEAARILAMLANPRCG
jgi:hypothetical protein